MARSLLPIGILAAAFLSGFIARLLLPSHTWVNLPLHSTLESSGGLAAVLMGLVLLARKAEWEDARLQGVASGFLGMGILEGFHAISSPDHGFVLLRSAASLLGGVAFSFVWHPPEMIGKRTRELIPYLVTAGTLAFGISVLAFSDQFPRFTTQQRFAPTALVVNGLAAVLFLAGAAGFWLEAGRTGRPEHQLLATLGLLFGSAETMFLFSGPWDSEWWVWHVVRVSAYVLALTYVSRGYVGMVGQTRQALAETKRSGRRLAAEYAVTRILAESATIKDATPGVLRVIGESLDWEIGMFWRLDEQNQVLRLIDLWHAPGVEASEFIQDSKDRTFQRGEGLVGRVWATRKSMWIPDVCADPTFRRAPMAARIGLNGAFAFPVSKGEQLYGVIDCFTRTSREPDRDVLEMMADLGIKVGVFVDRKRTEEELRETEARLVQEQRLAEVARVLGDIGHDVKNLLMPISTGAELLEEELNECFAKLPETTAAAIKPTREMTHELTEMIRQSSRRIHDRVKEIADSVKGLTRPPQFAPSRLADVVSNVYQALRILAEERHVALRAEGLDTLPVIRADESRLFNAIYNLVNNAIPEVSPGGSVTVRGRLDTTGQHVVLSVIDTGKGMSPEVRDSLFSYQAISRKVGGTGLGTKIVKDVVDAHGGTIAVESTEGKGTAFHITLAVKGPSDRAPRAPLPQPTS
ncbi:MAG TPA: GAF domain-containing sensor histidine kinase [Nitrospira sp.]|nr:GAF domain-containing sensor histidine kinase [Nitrospira sp.]